MTDSEAHMLLVFDMDADTWHAQSVRAQSDVIDCASLLDAFNDDVPMMDTLDIITRERAS